MPGKRVQLHALVDLESRWAERFAGCGRRANILTAIALDAGVGIEKSRPSQILQLVCARLQRIGFEIQIFRRQDSGGRPARGQVFGRGGENMDVLGKRKVHQECQHAAECTPEPKDAPGLGIAGCESMREQRCEWLKAIRPFHRKLRARAHRAAAHVEENESRDDERVDANAAVLYVLVQHGSLVEGEVAAAG